MTILEINCGTRPSYPFGQVTDAFLRVRAILVPAEIYQEDRALQHKLYFPSLEKSFVFSVDGRDEEISYPRVVCFLPILKGYTSREEALPVTGVTGLVLERMAASRYRRVGCTSADHKDGVELLFSWLFSLPAEEVILI